MKPTAIRAKMKLAGGLLSFVLVCVIVLTVMMNEMSKKDALIINIAGKERMLTQKMSKEIFFLIHRHHNDFRELNAAVDLFENNLNILLYGNSIKGIYPPQNEKIASKLQEVMSIWKPFKEEIESLKQNIEQVRPDIEVLTQRTEKLLFLSDIVVKKMVDAHLDGVHIDLSGRQRMLSQRMGLYVGRYLRTANAQDFLIFSDAKALYDKTMKDFLNDPEVKKHEDVFKIVQENNNYWEDFELYLSNLLTIEDQISKHVSYIHAKNVQLLNAMDDAVWLYTEHSEDKNDMFVKFQYIALIIGIITILYGFLISKEIIEHVESFVRRAKELASGDISLLSKQGVVLSDGSEDELKEASSHISLFVQKVNIAMKDSEDALKKAENAITQLQQLAEEVEDAIGEMGIDENEKRKFDKNVNATEDIAIQSAENLIHVNRMLQKLKKSLNAMVENSANTEEKPQ